MTTQRSIDDGEQPRRCRVVRAAHPTAGGGDARVVPVPAGVRRSVAPPREPTARPAQIDQLRQVAVHVETAAVLERRACSSDNPTLAARLRERAAAHRVMAVRLRTAPAEQMPSAPLPRTAGRDRT